MPPRLKAVTFDRDLHQVLPSPLAHAYRKAYNSPSPKDLHDNACLFGLCLLRFLAVTGVALFRESPVTLSREEQDLVAKTDRPAEGDWLRWLVRAARRVRERRPLAASLAARLDAFVYGKRDASRSEIPGTVSHLLAHVEKKISVRQTATAYEFFDALVRYRNDTIGHGAVLSEDLNRAAGEVVLRAVTDLVRELPFAEGWELKYVAESLLKSTSVECRYVNLTGPDWLREEPLAFPHGYPTPPAGHVVLAKRGGSERCVDLHPLVVFHDERVRFFNSLRGVRPAYLEYESGEGVTLEALAQDFANWKVAFGAAGTGTATAAAPEAVPGVGQRFRFDRLLGRGGMGEVWLAYDETLKRPVAIKRVRADLLGRPEMNQRFLQEARDAAALNHPNVVPILSIDSDGQGHFLVLEYMEGGNLRRRLAQERLRLPVALAYLRQLLEALAHAHARGLVHCDLKPENILLSKAGIPKLADFGLAWLVQEQAEGPPARSNRPGEGTRDYQAPEVRGGASPTPRTDLYSLGVTFFEMLTALPPHPLVDKRVPSPALPLLRKLVHPDPNLRYPDAEAALHDCVELERALELARRSAATTRENIRRTAEKSFQSLAEGRPIDARAGFERILAEDPDHSRALTGLLLIHLMNGEMDQGALRYRALAASGTEDEVFARLRNFFDGIRRPSVLRVTPRPQAYSYRVEDLREGRLVKELTELEKGTINLGDVGELLIELAQQRGGGKAVSYSSAAADCHRLCFDVGGPTLHADFRFHVKPGLLFLPPRLLAADATLSVDGDPFEIYRVIRYLTSNLARRFDRERARLIDPAVADSFGYKASAALAEWDDLEFDLRRRILLPA